MQDIVGEIQSNLLESECKKELEEENKESHDILNEKIYVLRESLELFKQDPDLAAAL